MRVLAPREGAAPYYAQWGWTAADGRTKVPANDTDWTVDAGGRLTPATPVTLRWDNGEGQLFEIALSLDENYMVTAEQRVRNTAAEPVQLLPWARVRRESTPPTQGFYILHEGFVGVLDGRLREADLRHAKSDGAKRQRRGAGAGDRRRLGRLHRQVLAGRARRRPTRRIRTRAAFRHVRMPGRAGRRTAGRSTWPPPARSASPPAPPPASPPGCSPAPRR